MTSGGYILRFADPATAQLYPGPVAGEIDWHQSASRFQAEFPLGNLAAGSIVAPSLSVLGNPAYEFQFELRSADQCWSLPPVPSQSAQKTPAPQNSRVAGKIDCWHLAVDLSQARLQVSCTLSAPPERYLLSASIRPVLLSSLGPPPVADFHNRPPPQHSQMLENPRIADRICSAVSLQMVLAYHRRGIPVHEVLAACRDPATAMYGVWPLAIRAASQYGCLGAVELFTGWEPVANCLSAGLPVIASIRFAAGKLPGSPMRSTGGHLVVVYGIADGRVLVNDPAAPDHGSVRRTYPLAEFSEAWFRHRGAAYILLP